MTEFVKELQERYFKAHDLEINKFLKKHKDDLKDLKALMRYAADHHKTRVSFITENQCITWQKFVIRPNLQRFIVDYSPLIAEVTGLEIKVVALGCKQIAISFEKEKSEDE